MPRCKENRARNQLCRKQLRYTLMTNKNTSRRLLLCPPIWILIHLWKTSVHHDSKTIEDSLSAVLWIVIFPRIQCWKVHILVSRSQSMWNQYSRHKSLIHPTTFITSQFVASYRKHEKTTIWKEVAYERSYSSYSSSSYTVMNENKTVTFYLSRRTCFWREVHVAVTALFELPSPADLKLY